MIESLYNTWSNRIAMLSMTVKTDVGNLQNVYLKCSPLLRADASAVTEYHRKRTMSRLEGKNTYRAVDAKSKEHDEEHHSPKCRS